MQNETVNPLFLIVGPPAVGKSTTSRALASQFPKSIHISVDQLRDMVVSGLVLPSADVSAELIQQFYLARTTAIRMATLYANAGYLVVIDDVLAFNLDEHYQDLLNHANFHKILLYPSQKTAHERNFQRSGTSPARAYIDEGIQIVYQALEPQLPHLRQNAWHILDTSALTVEMAVQAILRQTIKTT